MNRPRASRPARKSGESIRPMEPLPPPLPLALLERPLDYFLAEHHRHRNYLACLRQAATARWIPPHDARRLIAFLAVELPLHWADEKIDLFPSLRRHSLPEDGLEEVLARLDDDHAMSALNVGRIMAGLSAAIPSKQTAVRLDPALCGLMQTYATGEAHHLAIENAVVLAIAGVRLRKTDLSAIAAGMKARREPPHVGNA